MFERIPRLAKPLAVARVPRFVRWEMPHPKLESCNQLLDSLSERDVVKFYVMRAEERFRQGYVEVFLYNIIFMNFRNWCHE